MALNKIKRDFLNCYKTLSINLNTQILIAFGLDLSITDIAFVIGLYFVIGDNKIGDNKIYYKSDISNR